MPSSRPPPVSPAVIRPPSTIPRLPYIKDYVRPSPSSETSSSAATDVARTLRIAPLRHLFDVSLPRLAVCIPATASTAVMQAPALRNFISVVKGVRTVQNDPSDPNKRLVVLNVEHEDELSEDAQAHLCSLGGQLVAHSVHFGYDYFTADQVLGSLLPAELAKGTPTSFTVVGHIAHLNLRDEYLPYRFLIGDVILEKNSRAIRTVVNKLDTIDAQYRFFEMELLAGDAEFETTAVEQGCTYTFDFRAIYFNSRLHAEHARLAQLAFNGSDVVIDVMAGVGPFAIPAAKKERGNIVNRDSAIHSVSGSPNSSSARRGAIPVLKSAEQSTAGPCWVLANDLNPASMYSLALNVAVNKVEDRVFVPRRADVLSQNAKGKQRFVDSDHDDGLFNEGPDSQPFGLDGREFIRRATRWVWDGVSWPKAKEPVKRHSARQKVPKKADAPAAPKGTSPKTEQERKQSIPVVSRAAAKIPQHYIMNLPGSAIEFMDVYRGLFSRIFDGDGERELVEREFRAVQGQDSALKYPLVHVHCFTKALEEPYEEIIARANRALGFDGGASAGGLEVPAYHERPPKLASITPAADGVAGSEGTAPLSAIPPVSGDSVPPSAEAVARGREVQIHFVRRVAPNKDMYCLSFRLWPECVWK